jgi:hypothetical protein
VSGTGAFEILSGGSAARRATWICTRSEYWDSQWSIGQAKSRQKKIGNRRFRRDCFPRCLSAPNLVRVTLKRDGIFADNTPELAAAQTIAVTGDGAAGFKGSVTVGIAG